MNFDEKFIIKHKSEMSAFEVLNVNVECNMMMLRKVERENDNSDLWYVELKKCYAEKIIADAQEYISRLPKTED